jgi:hypothetical protein
MGDDLRLNGLTLAGAALEISGQIVHLVSFPGTMYRDQQNEHPRRSHMARARMRRISLGKAPLEPIISSRIWRPL